MDKSFDQTSAETDAPTAEAAGSGEPTDVLMSRLATLYEPRVLDWIYRVKDATRDND